MFGTVGLKLGLGPKPAPTIEELINIPQVELMVRTAYRSGLYRDGVNQLINVWKGISTSERQRSIDSQDKEVRTGM